MNNSTLILTTNASIEEYSKRAQAYLDEIDQKLKNGSNLYHSIIDYYYDQKYTLQEFLKKTEIARRNPKLQMHISIDDDLFFMLHSEL